MDITLNYANRINHAHEAAQAAARSAIEFALEAGRLLLEVKAGLAHGELGNWIAEHCRVSPRTARAYMKLARDYESLPEAKRQRVASLPFRDAVRELATPKPDPATKADGHAAIETLVRQFQPSWEELLPAIGHSQCGMGSDWETDPVIIITAPVEHPGFYHLDLMVHSQQVSTRRPVKPWFMVYTLVKEGLFQPLGLNWSGDMPAERNPFRSPARGDLS